MIYYNIQISSIFVWKKWYEKKQSNVVTNFISNRADVSIAYDISSRLCACICVCYRLATFSPKIRLPRWMRIQRRVQQNTFSHSVSFRSHFIHILRFIRVNRIIFTFAFSFCYFLVFIHWRCYLWHFDIFDSILLIYTENQDVHNRWTTCSIRHAWNTEQFMHTKMIQKLFIIDLWSEWMFGSEPQSSQMPYTLHSRFEHFACVFQSFDRKTFC